jgi:hypothetical protein
LGFVDFVGGNGFGYRWANLQTRISKLSEHGLKSLVADETNQLSR